MRNNLFKCKNCSKIIDSESIDCHYCGEVFSEHKFIFPGIKNELKKFIKNKNKKNYVLLNIGVNDYLKMSIVSANQKKIGDINLTSFKKSDNSMFALYFTSEQLNNSKPDFSNIFGSEFNSTSNQTHASKEDNIKDLEVFLKSYEKQDYEIQQESGTYYQTAYFKFFNIDEIDLLSENISYLGLNAFGLQKQHSFNFQLFVTSSPFLTPEEVYNPEKVRLVGSEKNQIKANEHESFIDFLWYLGYAVFIIYFLYRWLS